MTVKNKILIILDGSEILENSINFMLNSNFFEYSEINLFFILHPLNPITESQSKQVIYNDYVHDHGRKLAKQYLEKITKIIKEYNLDTKISVNIVNSKNNIIERISLGDIFATFISSNASNRISYLFGNRDLGYFVKNINPLLVIPIDSNIDINKPNHLYISYFSNISKNPFINLFFDEKTNLINIQNINLIAKNSTEKEQLSLLSEKISKNYHVNIIENKDNIPKILNKLENQENIIVNISYHPKSFIINSFSKNSISYFLKCKIPILINSN